MGAVNWCPTCNQQVPAGFNCEEDQRKKGLAPPDPCENPTRGEQWKAVRFHKMERTPMVVPDPATERERDTA